MANKIKVNLGNAGLGAASHLCGLLLQSALKVDMTTVPYKGTVQGLQDLLGGATSAWIGPLGDVERFHRAGKARVIAGRDRSLRIGAFARGEIEIGLGQISEILANKDIVMVGPLPAAIQSSVAFSAGAHTSAAQPDVVQAFIAYLVTPAAQEKFRAVGFEVK